VTSVAAASDRGVLGGVRVVDFGRYIAGPYCAALLADFGADVIRVEKREGSEDRFLLPVAESGDGALFMQMNRNKRSMTLDPMHAAGRDIVRALVATADVVVANLPPPTLVAMGLDYASLCAIKPDIILTSVSAYGTTGPYRDRVGFDGIGQAMSGSIYMTGNPDEPYRAMTAFVDFGTALSAAYGTALALLDRARTGTGRVVEASLLGTALNFTNSTTLEQSVLGIDRIPSGNRAQSSAPADLFRASDGWILVQVVGNPLFKRVARLIGANEWLEDPRFATDMGRGENGTEISARVAAWCADRPVAQALAELDAARIPCGPVYSPQQTLDDPHVRAANMLGEVPFPGAPRAPRVAQRIVALSGEPAPAFRRAPLLGEHTDAILRELGFDEAAIAGFEASGAI
jgi:crotonobetainyl-CoA:carnitine CoA-transferase CaiB-like acyl-CoA transferase